LPRADFRYGVNSLDPLALVKLLAVMCHPTDPRGREAMLRQQPVSITIARHQAPGFGTMEASADALWSAFAEHKTVAGLAGAYCLALAQLSALGRNGEAAAALHLAVNIAGQWETALRAEAAVQPAGRSSPRAEAEIRDAFERYRGVSHLWAALVYGAVHGRRDITPTGLHAMALFLAYSTEIARLACALRWADADGPLPLSPSTLWTFILPDALAQHAKTQLFLAPFILRVEPPHFGSGEAIGV